MIKRYSLLALQKAINYALSLDETTNIKLTDIQGRVIAIHILPLEVSFYMVFESNAVILLSTYEGNVDTTIRSSPMGLIRLSILPASKVRSLFNDKVHISGDVILGQQVKALFDELNIDWEGHLAYFTGDMVAHHLGSLFKRGQAFARQLGDSSRQNISAYVQEELRILPPTEEVNDFSEEVDTLAVEVERLEAVWNYIVKKYEKN